MSKNNLSCHLCAFQVTASSIPEVFEVINKHYQRNHHSTYSSDLVFVPPTPPFAPEPIEEDVSGVEFAEEWKLHLSTQKDTPASEGVGDESGGEFAAEWKYNLSINQDTLASEAEGVNVDKFITLSAPSATEHAESSTSHMKETSAAEYIEYDDEEEKDHPEKPEEAVAPQRKRGRPKMSEDEKKKKAESIENGKSHPAKKRGRPKKGFYCMRRKRRTRRITRSATKKRKNYKEADDEDGDYEDAENEVIPSKMNPDAAPAPAKKRKFSTKNDDEDPFSDDSSISQAPVGDKRKSISIEAEDSVDPGEETSNGSSIVPKQMKIKLTRRGPGRPKRAESHQELLPIGKK